MIQSIAAPQPRTSEFQPSNRWFREAVFYELPVKSFFDASGDGIGDFSGLTRKLDYIADLGVTCLWLLPFFPSPWRDDGFDVSDYRAIHPAYGTIDDFHTFIREAHRRGLYVAAEMVINHTSDQHPWFQTAKTYPANSSLRDFYVWANGRDRFADAKVLASDDTATNWSWDPVAEAYYWHRFGDHQPDLNFDNPIVQKEMLQVLRFWANLGVDGLCLNGAAFLAERDGTRCEHLEETHQILKHFRAELASEFPGLMLQAGVHAPPHEASTYFGNGDEAHMVPHLALVPRILLALAQEDGQPLVDILRQTHVPPADGQWVTLLRNHDELSLSLTTADEEEILLQHLAADPSMRLHRGILRRLAPLAENNRRRIELLYGLLFALPGAPLIYYGDEIGMGDNVFLRSRDGVRTPMQWSSERNGGFSTADFERLYAPPLTDPLFGYQVVNVEAQQRDPWSLLHWVRRLVGFRKRHRSLSWGGLQILESSSRKVLAFVRSCEPPFTTSQMDQMEPVIAVCNLSRASQVAELDLSQYAGLFPVDIFSQSDFPRIGESPYVITLPPFAFWWFRLQKRPTPPPRQRIDDESVESEKLARITWADKEEELFEGRIKAELEESILPTFLKSQRWFGGKAQNIEHVRIVDYGRLSDISTRSWITFLEVQFSQGKTAMYALALGIIESPAAFDDSKWSYVLATLDGPNRKALLIDALAHEEFCLSLLAALEQRQEMSTCHGTIVAHPTPSFSAFKNPSEPPLTVKLGKATSSNSVLMYGRRLLLKFFRRLEAGINPDFEIGMFLTEKDRFPRTPGMAGTIEYRRDDRIYSLAILQEWVANQGDGWQHALDELTRYYDRALARTYGADPISSDERSILELSNQSPPPVVLETLGTYLIAARTLGRRTAEMHGALVGDSRGADFQHEPMTNADWQRVRTEIQTQSDRALATLEQRKDRLADDIAAHAELLLDHGQATIQQVIDTIESRSDAMKTRIHGDYHLGQVLWSNHDYVIIDFEGEPTRSVAERREKFSPMRDVAGMLRSYEYAAYAALFTFAGNRTSDFSRLVPWADLWQQWVSATFLGEYLRVSTDREFLPRDRVGIRQLLDAFTLAKALYELTYELNNRPDWVRIPLAGLIRLLGLSRFATS